MEKFFIIGGNHLEGEVEIDSAKNSILPLMAASLLVEGEVVDVKLAPFAGEGVEEEQPKGLFDSIFGLFKKKK